MNRFLILILPILVIFFSSCEAIKGIFKAGMGFGIFITIAVIVLIIYLLTRIGGRKK